MRREAIAHLLSGCEILGGLGVGDRLRVADLAQLVVQPAGAVIFFQGDPPDALYVVRRGLVHVVQAVADGRERLLVALGPGSGFGEIALLDGEPRSATAIARRDTELVRIPRAAFLDLVARRPELALSVIQVLCGRVRTNDARVEEGLFLSARARVARHLVRLVGLHGVTEPDGSVRVDQRLSQAELGGAVGLSRQSVNQVLQALQAEGVVRLGRARLVVTAPEALDRAARPGPA